jgi:hypothetical protein
MSSLPDSPGEFASPPGRLSGHVPIIFMARAASTGYNPDHFRIFILNFFANYERIFHILLTAANEEAWGARSSLVGGRACIIGNSSSLLKRDAMPSFAN